MLVTHHKKIVVTTFVCSNGDNEEYPSLIKYEFAIFIITKITRLLAQCIDLATPSLSQI